jgi:hypothetical protein
VKTRILLTIIITLGLILPASLKAQQRGDQGQGQRGQRGQRGRGDAQAAPAANPAADLTGYWVSVVTEDWEYRMRTAPKGDFGGLGGLPINEEGRKVADTWDPAKDEASGNQCKAYGAAAIMRVPGRLHITMQDGNSTLRIDTDAGTQTRLLHFGASKPPEGESTWQGYSVAQWEGGGGRGRGTGGGGSLKVVTTHMKPGYLRKNGAPYSANALLTEYFDMYPGPNGDQLLVVTSVVEDPQYLSQPFTTSTNFKKLPDSAGWSPTPCSAR